MDLRVAGFAKADKVLFYTESTSAPLYEVMNFYPTGFATIDAASPSIKLVSFVYSVTNFFWYMC